MQQQEICPMCALCRKLTELLMWQTVWVAVSMSVLLIGSNLQAQSVPTQMLGSWRLVGVYSTDNIQGLYPEEQRKLLGTKVVFESTSITSCEQSVNVTSVIRSRVSADDLLEAYHTTFKSLGIKSRTVEKVVLNNNASGNCLGSLTLPGEEVYLKSHDEICVNLDGVFFKAVRIRAKAREAGARRPGK